MKLTEMIEKMYEEAKSTMATIKKETYQHMIQNKIDSDPVINAAKCFEQLYTLLDDTVIKYRFVSDRATLKDLRNNWLEIFKEVNIDRLVDIMMKCKVVIKRATDDNPIEIVFPQYVKGGVGINVLNGGSWFEVNGEKYGVNQILFSQSPSELIMLNEYMRKIKADAVIDVQHQAYYFDSRKNARMVTIELECDPFRTISSNRANVFPSTLSWGGYKYVSPDMVFNDEIISELKLPTMVCFDPLRRTINIKGGDFHSIPLTARMLYDQLTIIRDNFSYMKDVEVTFDDKVITDITAEVVNRYRDRKWDISVA